MSQKSFRPASISLLYIISPLLYEVTTIKNVATDVSIIDILTLHSQQAHKKPDYN